MKRNIFRNKHGSVHYRLDTKSSFTLIEILMVFGILSLIIGFVIFRFPASSERARDTKRQSDLKSYQGALELYAMKNGGLYPTSSYAPISTICTALGMSGSTCVSDPTSGTYYYETDPTGVKYAIWSALERSSDTYIVCSDGRNGIASVTPAAGVCPTFNVVSLLCGNGALDSGEVCDDGNIVSGDGCSAACTSSCSDSDTGSNYYVNGTVTYNSGSGSQSDADSCSGFVTLIEGTCNSSDVYTQDVHPCLSGELCTGGVCVSAPICGNGTVEAGEICDDGNVVAGDGCFSDCSRSCTDSDGGIRLYQTGSVTVTDASGTVLTPDSCQISTNLNEQRCQTDDTLGLVSSSCINGCVNGKCTFSPFRNSSSGNSCAQRCANSPFYMTCADIGTDSLGTNNAYATYIGYCTSQTGDCNTSMNVVGTTCFGTGSAFRTNWTNCKCI